MDKEAVIGLAAAAAGAAALYKYREKTRTISLAGCQASSSVTKVQAGQVIDGLPEYTLDEIQRHATPGDGGKCG